MSRPATLPEPALQIAVAGNPNAGKTTIFNCLTGLRQKVGNYPGVTVEKKLGRTVLDQHPAEVLDLPGAYSLSAQSPDEEVARDVLFGWQDDTPPPDVVVVVVDASNLDRNLFLASQIIELGYRTVIALNMVDIVESSGGEIDHDALARRLGVPVVKTVARTGKGLDRLRATIFEAVASDLAAPLVPPLARAVQVVAQHLTTAHDTPPRLARGIALRLLSSPSGLDSATKHYGRAAASVIEQQRAAMQDSGLSWQGCEAASRYPWLGEIAAEAIRGRAACEAATFSDRVDRLLTHRIWGVLIFLLSMGLVFQSIYTWAIPAMDWIDGSFAALASVVGHRMAPGVLHDLVIQGIIPGVGSVVIFLPQILMLFLFLSLLEDSGYMARAAFVMDRIMSKVGLHGRSFVPLLSSFACAIPGIMAARTIASRRDRLTTILVAPLITCSARLPVYALLIAAFVPRGKVLGGLVSAQGLALMSLYLLGVVGALTMAALFKRTILKGPAPALLIELPPYRWPDPRNVVRELTQRAWLFVRFAGSVILSLSIVLWFLSSYPRADVSGAPSIAEAQLTADGAELTAESLAAEAAVIERRLQLENSYLGHLGHSIEPLVRPLGFDWHLGVGLLAAFAAREVMVSTLGILYAAGDDVSETDQTLMQRLRHAERSDGSTLFTTPVVWSLLVFFVFACQCLSTVGVVVRETGGWRWAMFMVVYMTTLAYLASLATYHGLRAAGLG